jgi:hypothetical protein
MPYARFLVAISLLCGAFTTQPNAGEPEKIMNKDQDALIRAISSAESSTRAGKLFLELFARSDAKRLATLMNDENLTIALQSEWRLNRLKTDLTIWNVHRVIGHIEGRVRVSLPERWEIRSACSLCEKNLHIFDTFMTECYPSSTLMRKQGLYYVFSPEGEHNTILGAATLDTDVKETNGTYAVRVDKQESKIVANLERDCAEHKRGPMGSNRKVAFGLHNQIAIMAAFDAGGGYVDVFCYDVPSGRRIWKATGWSLGERMLNGWNPYHIMDVRFTEETVIILGTGLSDCYLEVFDSNTGKSIGRFSTDLWHVRE